MKKLIMATLIASIGLVGCGGGKSESKPDAAAPSASAEKKHYKVGAAVYGMKGEFMQMWVHQLKGHPLVKDGTVEVTVFDGNYDALTQNNQFDTMITQKFDAILFVPIDIKAGAAAVEKAAAANIPVVASNTTVDSDKVFATINNDDEKGGELQAETLAKMMNYKGNVVLLEGPTGQSAQISRTKGNMTTLAKYPEIKMIEKKPANWSRAEARSLMENWLTAHPGKINGVLGQNDDIGMGAISAIVDKGVDLKTVPVVGIDGVKDGILSVKNSQMGSFFQDAKAQAQGALDLAMRAVQGEKYQPQSVIWKEYAEKMPWNNGTAKSYSIPWTEITPANADEMLKKLD